MKINGCVADFTFQNGFILLEEHLVTISSMIRERYPQEEIIYKMTKSNSYIYQTNDLNEVISEENGRTSKIIKLEILVSDDDIIKISICFEKNESTLLKLEGIDKDLIYLLYNELKTYMDKEITVVKYLNVSKNISKYVMNIIMILLIGFLIFDLYKINNMKLSSDAELIAAIKSSDLELKINYLLNQQLSSKNPAIAIDSYTNLFMIPLIFTVLLMFLPELLGVLWGNKGIFVISDFFLIGKEKTAYEQKSKTKSQIKWTIIGGLVVSILGSLVVFFLTKS